MRYLGIDYGTKNIGLAISDEKGTMAFPRETIQNNDTTLQFIVRLIEDEKIGAIVIGESVDQTGEPNPIMIKIKDFVGQFSLLVAIPIHFEKESFTSVEAGKQIQKKPTARRPKQKLVKNDASSSAFILQRFLDRQITRR